MAESGEGWKTVPERCRKRECSKDVEGGVEGRNKKQKDKMNFIKKFFPTTTNSPGGTLKLIPEKISSAEGGEVEKMKAWRSSNFPFTKLIFEENCIVNSDFSNYDVRRISQIESKTLCVTTRGGPAVIGSADPSPGQSEERTVGEVAEDWSE